MQFCTFLFCNYIYRKKEGKYLLKDCLDETKHHLDSLKIIKRSGHQDEIAEWKLILMRAGIFPDFNKYQNFEICAAHRSKLGIEFTAKLSCEHPNHSKQSNINRIFRNINFELALEIIKKRTVDLDTVFIPVGSSLCETCYKIIESNLVVVTIENRFTALKDFCENQSKSNL